MSHLSPLARELLQQARAHSDAVVGDADATWQSLARSIERGDAPMALDGPRPTTSRKAIAILVALTSFAAAAAIFWTAGGARMLREHDEPMPTASSFAAAADAAMASVVEAQPRAPSRARAAGRPRAVPSPSASAAPVEVPDRPGRRSKRRDASKTTSGPALAPRDAGHDVIQALARARAALRDGDTAAAQRLLRALAREHPGGAYAEERELLVIAALCQAGRVEQAQAAAERFRRVHRGSPLTTHLARGCVGSR